MSCIFHIRRCEGTLRKDVARPHVLFGAEAGGHGISEGIGRVGVTGGIARGPTFGAFILGLGVPCLKGENPKAYGRKQALQGLGVP